MTLLLTYLGTALTGSDRCECKTCSPMDKMGEESWDSWAPGGGLANQAPGLATFQVLQDKTHSINWKPGLQFGHRLMTVSVCVHPGIISRNAELPSLTSHPQSRVEVLPGTLSQLGLQMSVTWNLPALFKSGCWSKPSLVMYPLLFLFLFSLNVSILKVN